MTIYFTQGNFKLNYQSQCKKHLILEISELLVQPGEEEKTESTPYQCL